jgi:hypothetical protein
MDFHRLGVKFFAADPASIHLMDFIPIFHRWIQNQNVDGHLLIDVHDYSHMQGGPGILLVAHEGNFSIDMGGERPGLAYFRKIPTALSPAEHMALILTTALNACRRLEKDASIRFDRDELIVTANDRLNAPNTEPAFAELQPVVGEALKRALDGMDFKLARLSADPRQRLAIHATAAAARKSTA